MATTESAATGPPMMEDDTHTGSKANSQSNMVATDRLQVLVTMCSGVFSRPDRQCRYPTQPRQPREWNRWRRLICPMRALDGMTGGGMFITDILVPTTHLLWEVLLTGSHIWSTVLLHAFTLERCMRRGNVALAQPSMSPAAMEKCCVDIT